MAKVLIGSVGSPPCPSTVLAQVGPPLSLMERKQVLYEFPKSVLMVKASKPKASNYCHSL